MNRRLVRIMYGYFYWMILKIRYLINYKKVVLFLTDENSKLDITALEYLQFFLERKNAKSVIVFYVNDNTYSFINNNPEIKNVCRCKKFSHKRMLFLYNVYSFYNFFENAVFTYTTIPKDNLLGRILNETDINEVEAVCLALYHLREIPSIGEEI